VDVGRPLREFPSAVGATASSTGPSTAQYDYDGTQLLVGAWARYVYGADGDRIARLGGGPRLWFINDRTGRPLTLVDDNAVALIRVKKPGAYKTPDESVVRYQRRDRRLDLGRQRLVWTTWSGLGQNSPGLDDPFVYGIGERDLATKLYYTSERWYDAESGRYLNENPNGLAGENAYRYQRNNPKNIEVDTTDYRDGFTKAVGLLCRRGGHADGGDDVADASGHGLRRRGAVRFGSVRRGAQTWAKALNLSLMVLNPANASGWLADGLKVINTTATVGGAISAAEALGHGDNGRGVDVRGGFGWCRCRVARRPAPRVCSPPPCSAACTWCRGFRTWSRRTRCSPRATSSAACWVWRARG